MDIWMIVLFLVGGFILGYYGLIPEKYRGFTGIITYAGLIVLLISMGSKIGMDDRILKQLDQIGFQALMLAMASIIGSLILVKFFSRLFESHMEGGESDRITGGEQGNNHFMTLVIIGSVIMGIVVGFYLIPAAMLKYIDRITGYALAVLLFGIGIDIGNNRQALIQLKRYGWRILFIPVMVVFGSIGGALFCGPLLGLAGKEAAAVGAGFGWYSLSGILLSNLYSLELGSLAFLSNVFRELLTILSLPLIVKYLGRWTGIAPGGATTMDVTLPLIKETAGEEIVIPAFINGVVLSFLVPILVPFIINL